ncbi:IS3 family transposase [Streptosporangium sp. NPDC023963]|uniref:IS3 family transposase n=1 Tax=Streptosporangium sp. NPDC023963 TaxID=3155608 RepID=UPI00341B2587
MKFIDEHPGLAAVELILRVLGVPTPTYYGWRERLARPSARAVADALLLEEIKKIRADHEFADTYGSPRVHLELRRRGIRVSRKRVERLMRAAGLQGAFMRKGYKVASTRQDPRHQAAPDLVNRNFSAPAPNQLWVADLTRILTGEGVLWLASARDVFSNRVVGWKTSDRADTELVLGALEFAL